MPDPRGERWRFIAVRQNRPFLIFDPREWVYTGHGFVSKFSSEAKSAMPFGELWMAEGIASHLRMTGLRVCARRATYDESKRLEHETIRKPPEGQRVIQRRFKPKDQPVDGGEYWPHR